MGTPLGVPWLHRGTCHGYVRSLINVQYVVDTYFHGYAHGAPIDRSGHHGRRHNVMVHVMISDDEYTGVIVYLTLVIPKP